MNNHVRIYTRAISFPKLIGRTPDGKRIPGGPYTLTQATGAGAVAFLLWQTTSLWAVGGLFTNIGIFAAAVGTTVFVLGKIPAGSRNPLSMAAGFGKAVTAPLAIPKIAGRAPRRRTARAFIGSVQVITPPSPARAPAPARAARAHFTSPARKAPRAGSAVHLAAMAASGRK